MNEFTYLFLITLAVGTALQFWLTVRHIRHVNKHQQQVPVAFAEKITLEEHQKAARYTTVKAQFEQITLVFNTILLLILTLGGVLDWLDHSWRALEWSPLWTGVAVMLSTMLLSNLIELPFSLYNTFRIEAAFGFNRTTLSLFLNDLLKSLSLLLILGIPFISVVLWLMQSAGELWWLWVWAVWFSFSLLMMWIYPTFIAPLFNKFNPLDNQSLKQRIENLLQRNGFSSQGIFVMDGSKRTGHGNAYFTGLGRHKRIVFFDTLLHSLEEEEVEAVLAHEVGHFKHKHILKRIIWMAILSLAGLALLGWLITQPWFYHGMNVSTPSNYMALILFTLVLPVFTFFLSPLFSWASRLHEFEADKFAVQQTQSNALIRALVKLYKENASTLTPDPLHSAFYDSHPPAPVRIARLMTLS